MSNQKIYQKITQKVIDSLSKGKIAWQMPWVNMPLPMNYLTGKSYNGINLWLTLFSGHSSPYWLTYKQTHNLGGKIKRGAKGTSIVYWHVKTREVENEETGVNETKKSFFLRYYTIFNAEQIEDIEFNELQLSVEGAKDCFSAEEIISQYDDKPSIEHSNLGKAYYSPAFDKIHMPCKEQFKSTEDYYATLFHELGHSTGAKNRLTREGVVNFDKYGSHQYSIEELVAEMTSCFMMAKSGLAIQPRTNSTAYIQSWISKLENDSKFIFKAAKLAQQASDYMLREQLVAIKDQAA